MTQIEKREWIIARVAMIRKVITECGGNKSAAARSLGISRNRLKQLLKLAADLEKNNGPSSVPR